MKKLIGVTVLLLLVITLALIVIVEWHKKENFSKCDREAIWEKHFTYCYSNDGFYIVESDGHTWLFPYDLTNYRYLNGYIIVGFHRFENCGVAIIKDGKLYGTTWEIKNPRSIKYIYSDIVYYLEVNFFDAQIWAWDLNTQKNNLVIEISHPMSIHYRISDAC